MAGPQESIPSQAQVLEQWREKIMTEGKLYVKTSVVWAKELAEEGRLQTVVGGATETEKAYRPGDVLVLNPQGEQYVLDAATFKARYVAHVEGGAAAAEAPPLPAGHAAPQLRANGFKCYAAVGQAWRLAVTAEMVQAHFPVGQFMARWGEPMRVDAGDSLCVPHPHADEVYRIEAAAFAATYRAAA